MDARCAGFNHGLHQFEDVQWPTKASLGIGHDRCEPVSITLALRHLDLVCPLQSLCRAAFQAGRLARETRATYRTRPKEGPWRGSTRYYRGRIVAALAALPRGQRLTLSALAAHVKPNTEDGAITRLHDLVTKLAAEGLVVVHETDDGQLEVALPE